MHQPTLDSATTKLMCLGSLQLPTYADPILDRLDPQHLVSYRLYRDSTQYVNGKHMRDLSKLNRDLGKVLLITADPESSKLQPENAVQVCHATRPCRSLVKN